MLLPKTFASQSLAAALLAAGAVIVPSLLGGVPPVKAQSTFYPCSGLSTANTSTTPANFNTLDDGNNNTATNPISITGTGNSGAINNLQVTIDSAGTGSRGYMQVSATGPEFKSGVYDGTNFTGLNVNTTQTTLTGGGLGNTPPPSKLTLGTDSAILEGGGDDGSKMTLDSSGATFANNSNGRPIRVTGVADGVNPFDAVNYRQLQAVSTGVASIAAMSNIPGLETNKKFGIGIGYGNFQGNSALAVGINGRLAPSLTAKLSLGAGLSAGATSVGTGLSYAW